MISTKKSGWTTFGDERESGEEAGKETGDGRVGEGKGGGEEEEDKKDKERRTRRKSRGGDEREVEEDED